MREIKFRGKRAANGEWVYGDLLNYEDDHGKYLEIVTSYQGVRMQNFRIDPETVGQFTGLCDVNEKDVYEGDYLVCRKYIGGNFVENVYEKGSVGFKNGSFYLVRKEGHFRPLSWLTEFDYEFEVRGNIYDNPELLEGEEAV